MMHHHAMDRPTISVGRRRQPSRKSITEDWFPCEERAVDAAAQGDENANALNYANPPPPSKNNVDSVIQPTKMVKVKLPPAPPPMLAEAEAKQVFTKPPPPPGRKNAQPINIIVQMSDGKIKPPAPPAGVKPKPRTENNEPTFSISPVKRGQDELQAASAPAMARPALALDKNRFKQQLEEQLQHGPVKPSSSNNLGNQTINIVFAGKPPVSAATAKPSQPPPPAVPARKVVATAPAKHHTPTPPPLPKWVKVLGIPKNCVEVAIEQKRVTRLAKTRGAPKSTVRFMISHIVVWKDLHGMMEMELEEKRKQEQVLLI